MDLKRALEISRDLRSFGQTLKEFTRTVNDIRSIARSVKRLSGNPSGNDLGSKLIAAGMACIVFPEPIVSDLLGSTLIAAGALLRARKGPSMADIFREMRKITADLKEISVKL